MKLSLVPIEGETVISDEDRQRMKRRLLPIPSKALGRFGDEDREQIKEFLSSFMTLTERIHHDMKEHPTQRSETDSFDGDSAKLQAQRQVLFDNASPAVGVFIELVQIHAMELWPDLEMMIASIRGEDVQRDYDSKLKASAESSDEDVEAALKHAKNEQLEFLRQCRITPHEIKDLMQFHSLESLVKHLIEGRRMASGAFWDASHYDI